MDYDMNLPTTAVRLFDRGLFLVTEIKRLTERVDEMSSAIRAEDIGLTLAEAVLETKLREGEVPGKTVGERNNWVEAGIKQDEDIILKTMNINSLKGQLETAERERSNYGKILRIYEKAMDQAKFLFAPIFKTSMRIGASDDE